MNIKYFSILILLIFLCINCSDTINNPKEIRELNEIEKKVVNSSDEFGLNLFKKVNEFKGDKNIFISPLSVSMALGMALNGAKGSTYDAMQSTLEFSDLNITEINESYRSLIDLLTQIDSKVDFLIANSIWYKENMTFEKPFLDINSKYFDARISGLNFSNPSSVNIINNWVNESTKGKIKKIIDEIPSYVVMYLINAIYFKGNWKYEFDKQYTTEDIFKLSNVEKVNCQMMSQRNDKLLYFENDFFKAIDMPYGDGHFSMSIFLPNEGKAPEDIIENLSLYNWNLWLANFEKQTGLVQLPRFEIVYEYSLNEVLKSLGMEIAFDQNNADFTKIYEPGGLFISDVKHKTFVTLDEEGTEAAAVTSVEYGLVSFTPEYIFRVDRPFIFVIRESNTGSILFIGKIVNPVLSN
jgi:serpin B